MCELDREQIMSERGTGTPRSPLFVYPDHGIMTCSTTVTLTTLKHLFPNMCLHCIDHIDIYTPHIHTYTNIDTGSNTHTYTHNRHTQEHRHTYIQNTLIHTHIIQTQTQSQTRHTDTCRYKNTPIQDAHKHTYKTHIDRQTHIYAQTQACTEGPRHS